VPDEEMGLELAGRSSRARVRLGLMRMQVLVLAAGMIGFFYSYVDFTVLWFHIALVTSS
jgi:hypothetical protein